MSGISCVRQQQCLERLQYTVPELTKQNLWLWVTPDISPVPDRRHMQQGVVEGKLKPFLLIKRISLLASPSGLNSFNPTHYAKYLANIFKQSKKAHDRYMECCFLNRNSTSIYKDACTTAEG